MINQHSKKGLYVLCYVIFESGGQYYFFDSRNPEKTEIMLSRLDSVSYVARIRKVSKIATTCVPLDMTRVNIGVVLPDYGVGGWKGLINFLKLLWSRSVKVRLAEAVRTSSFIYAEAPSFEAWCVSNMARKMKKKLILEVNTELTLDFKYMWQRFGPVGLVLVSMISLLFKSVRRISAGGVYLNKSLLDKYPIAGSKAVIVCKPRLPREWYSSGPRSFSSPASRFLFVGNLEKVKQVDFMLKALNLRRSLLCAGWKLEIVGDGPERPNLEKLISKLDLKEYVVLRGRVKHDKSLRSIFMDNDILLIASLSETGPRVLLEAMGLGMPVLSTKVGLAQELLTDDCLADIGDLRDYADKLLRLSLAPELLMTISEVNRKKAESVREDILFKDEDAFFKSVIE